MEQMRIPQEMIVPFNYESQDLPRSVKELRPVIFQDGNDFCCVLGPDTRKGIFACGLSPQEALKNWQHNLDERIKNHPDDDEVAAYIIDALNASNKKVW
ncbi:hypothetical protein [Olivibacter sp. XZL3]|uniref:hypothetical protein n=1 Tax=Olivibacter sp. XZL3 TaxID=1735116 RepID=UPI0010650905|nr:hypothetical protein [Olivibacter sp. XZL3]